MIVKGTTKSGIEFKIDSKIKDDVRLLYLLSKAQDTEDVMDAGKSLMSLLNLIFGSEDNVLVFMNEVADKHKGSCSAKDMISELTEIFGILNAKNS